jgi:hypothetical protein
MELRAIYLDLKSQVQIANKELTGMDRDCQDKSREGIWDLKSQI